MEIIFPPDSPPIAAIAAAKIAGISLTTNSSVTAGSPPALVVEGGRILHGAAEILKHIGTVASQPHLYRRDADEAKQIDDWLDYAPGSGSELEKACNFIDQSLLQSTFLVGNSLSIADVAVWAALAGASLRWENLRKSNKYQNLVRWFDLMSTEYDAVLSDLSATYLGRKSSAKTTSNLKEPQASSSKTIVVGNGGNHTESAGSQAFEIDLPGAEVGKEKLHFAPEPSGYRIDDSKIELLNQYLPRKRRRRRKKFFTDMISSSASRLRALRAHQKPSTVAELDDSSMDQQRKRKGSSDLSKEVDIEALIAISVGFPVDSLTEEEIESNVVSQIGGTEQANYIIVRNHILARWRSNVSVWLTKDQVLESIRAEHKNLVNSSYNFLLHHGYINFGVAPAIKDVKEKLSDDTPKGSVIVIGAGLSGLAAAKQLIFMGFKVLVLEGRSRPGGRVRTKKMSGPDGSVVAAADLGGSVLTGINGNPLGVLARQLGFPLHKVRDICPLYLPDGRMVNSDVDSKVEVSFNKLLDRVCKLRQSIMEEIQSVDVSLGTGLEAFRRVYKVAEDPLERMLLDWHLANLEYANATLMSNLSMAYWDQDDPYEMGGDHCFIPGGNERLVRALAENLPIFYDHPVHGIQYGSDGVMVYAGDQEYQSDVVLCTVSLGMLKKGAIEFVPELPQRKRDAIERLGFGLLNKVVILFPYDFWGGEIDTFGHLTEDPDMRGEFFLFYSYSSVAGGPLLVALVAGEAALKFERMSPIDSVTRVLEILKGIFSPKGIAVPDPLQAVCTRWGQDQFSHGSYSYVAIGASGDDYDILAENVADRVFFAGEATNRQYPATMHGAFLSGMREAAHILRVAKRRSFGSAAKGANIIADECNDVDPNPIQPVETT